MVIPPLDGDISVITTPDGKSYHVKDLNSRGILTEITAALREKVDCKTNADSFYGTCATEAATAAKVVSLITATASGDYAATDDNFSLRPGVRISVKFTNTNTANNPTLNVNSTGAKPIWYSSAAITTSSLNMAGYANRVSSFVYDGTYWVWNGAGTDNNTTYTNMSQAEASAGTVTTGRVISAKVLSDTIEEHTADINAVLPELVDDGAKNKLSIGTPTSVPTGLTCTQNTDGTYTVSGTLTAANSISFNISAIEGDLVLSGCPEGGGDATYLLRITKSGSQIADSVDTGSGSNVFTMSGTGYALNIRFAAGTYTDVVFKPMICSKSEWDISQEYVPYALPNPELTAAAIEVIDSGTKNLLEHIAFTRTVNDVTYTVNADRSIQISSAGNNTQSLLYLVQNYTGVPAGNYVLSGCTGGSSTTYDLRVKVGNTTYINYDGGTEFYYNGTDNFEASIVVRALQTVNILMKPMICTKVDWDISQTYQPYRPNIMDAVFGPGTEIIGTSEAHQDLNNYTTPGAYFCRNSTNAGYVDNKPLGGSGFRLTVENISGTNTFRQTFIKPTDASRIYIRHYSTSTWSSWYVFEGTAMT